MGIQYKFTLFQTVVFFSILWIQNKQNNWQLIGNIIDSDKLNFKKELLLKSSNTHGGHYAPAEGHTDTETGKWVVDKPERWEAEDDKLSCEYKTIENNIPINWDNFNGKQNIYVKDTIYKVTISQNEGKTTVTIKNSIENISTEVITTVKRSNTPVLFNLVDQSDKIKGGIFYSAYIITWTDEKPNIKEKYYIDKLFTDKIYAYNDIL